MSVFPPPRGVPSMAATFSMSSVMKGASSPIAPSAAWASLERKLCAKMFPVSGAVMFAPCHIMTMAVVGVCILIRR